MKLKLLLGSIIITLAFLALAGCIPEKERINVPPEIKSTDLGCQTDNECSSGVCNFIKQDSGECMPGQCSTGEQAIGINGQTSFYCDHNNQWQKVKKFGEYCDYDYECLIITCKDNPGCHPGEFKYYCKNNECVAQQQPDPCQIQGLVRIIQKDEYFDKDKCIETFAQREIQTVCAPCGNGICDTDMENNCNCPSDCPKQFSLEEIALHNSRTDCWLLINEKVYDVTMFINSHPGGSAILQGCGQEATLLFETRPMGSGNPHSVSAQSSLQNYYLSELMIK